MKKEYFLKALSMLRSQLKEEEEKYEEVLCDKKLLAETKKIKQRIKSIRMLLLSMERSQNVEVSHTAEIFIL